jgi:alkylation response protein AidB-like acyl-CoA dehydrogenase
MTSEQLAMAGSIHAATKAGPLSWRDLASLGILSIAQIPPSPPPSLAVTPSQAGAASGMGAAPSAVGEVGSVADLAAALEALAFDLVPGPVLPTVVAGLVLPGRFPGLESGAETVAIQTAPGGPVLCAGETTHLLLTPAQGEWIVVRAGQVRITALESVDLTRQLAVVRVAEGERVWPAFDVLDTLTTLACAEAAGIAAWCVHTAAEYAKIRRQFGRAIGSFQAIKHLCATMHCRAEAAAAAAWDAARALGTARAAGSGSAGSASVSPPGPEPGGRSGADHGEFALAAAVAAVLALEAAAENAKDCIQVLGGIGFTWEHDAHRYLRRALSLRQLLGGTDRWRVRAAELALSGVRRTLTLQTDSSSDAVAGSAVGSAAGPGADSVAGSGVDCGAVPADGLAAGVAGDGGDFSADAVGASASDSGASDGGLRAVVERIAELPQAEQREALADSGLLVPAGPRQALAIDEELHRAGLSKPDLKIGAWAVPTILQHGTPAQRERFVRPTLLGELIWCQLFSEPEAGSDLAALRTRAIKVDGGWELTGQKVWTSLAHTAGWAICLARTDTEVPKHKGITYFLVRMDSPGIQIRPLREITGDAVFNEVFLDNVFVPDDCVVGLVGEGWRLARTTLANERVAMGTQSSVGLEVEKLLDSAAGPQARLGTLVANGTVLTLLNLRATLETLHDRPTDSTARKLLGVAHRQAVAEYALEMSGLDGAANGAEVHQFLLTRCLSIAGGTTQILLSVVGERVLGLPREP